MLKVMQLIPARLIKALSFSSVPGTATLQEIASSQPKGALCVCVWGWSFFHDCFASVRI
jgi:hypothetical protein